MLFEPKCKQCGQRCASIEVLAPNELPAEWASWPQARRDLFTTHRKVNSHYLLYAGPGGSNGWVGDPISPERAAAVLAVIANPTPETLRADFYDRAGMCGECAEFYCPKHWSISDSGYGRCPRGHGQSLDPHWSPGIGCG
jgi:hypothetical protein